MFGIVLEGKKKHLLAELHRTDLDIWIILEGKYLYPIIKYESYYCDIGCQVVEFHRGFDLQ